MIFNTPLRQPGMFRTPLNGRIVAPNDPLRFLRSFVVEGDSRSTITGAPTASPWPTQLRTALPALGAETYVNAAVAGETVAAMVGQYATQIAPHHTQNGTFTLMAGINDRSLSADTVIASNIQTIAANARAGFGRTYISLENIRNMGTGLVLGRVNNILLDAHAASPICDALIAPHVLVTESGDFVAADQLHPSVAGNTKIAAFLQRLFTEAPPEVTPIDPATASGVQLAVDISNPALLWNAGGTACANGETISQWRDRSSNGIHLSGTLGNRPVFNTSNPLRATFSAQNLTTASNFVRSGPFTVYGLIHDVKNFGSSFWFSDNRSFVARPTCFSNFGAQVIGEGPGNTVGTTVNTNAVSHRIVCCAIFDGANSRYYMDGRLIWSGSLASLSMANLLTLGGFTNNATFAFEGAIGGFSFHNGAHNHATVRGISKWYSDLGKTYFYPFES